MRETIYDPKTGAKLLYEEMTSEIKGSVIICAGGSYEWLSPREECPVAASFAKAGYQAYILKYDVGDKNAPIGVKPLRQLAWAVRTVRKKEAGLLAVCGFSAGGHLCSMLGVHYNDEQILDKELQKRSCPDAMILGYPLTYIGNQESDEIRRHLCAEEAQVPYMNTADYITSDTPSTFLWHTAVDELVPVQETIRYAAKLLEHGVYTELHIYAEGVHGLSVATPDVEEPKKCRYADEAIAAWFEAAVRWLEKVNRRMQK